MKPKKLIRKFIIDKLKEGEWEEINDINELNKLYEIKVREELSEIQKSEHKDIMEFVDLIQVAFSFAKVNGFTHEELSLALVTKSIDKGTFGKLALNNLNPINPSNKLYFETEETVEYLRGQYELCKEGREKQREEYAKLGKEVLELRAKILENAIFSEPKKNNT